MVSVQGNREETFPPFLVECRVAELLDGRGRRCCCTLATPHELAWFTYVRTGQWWCARKRLKAQKAKNKGKGVRPLYVKQRKVVARLTKSKS